MSKGQNDSGLMSSAGLVRYFDSENTVIQVSPKNVLLISFVFGLVILMLSFLFF